MNTVVTGRLRALGRAELTLLVRNKAALFSALFVPVALTVAVQSTVDGMDLSGTGLSLETVLMPASMGFVLLFAVYANLTGAYVVRREELVLKRLRTGEARDAEIMAGAALPAVIIALVQCALLMAGGIALLDVAAPEQAVLLLAGLLLGLAMMVAAAAVTAAFTRSAEAAQLTPMPLMMVALLGSGVFVPLEVLPDQAAAVCEWLPMSPVMELVRGGWTGGMGAGETLRALVTAAVWTALAGWVVRGRFRWEPRR